MKTTQFTPAADFKFLDAQNCFDKAINSGRLSTDINAANYVGYFMYMGTKGDKDLFKHVNTREYIA